MLNLIYCFVLVVLVSPSGQAGQLKQDIRIKCQPTKIVNKAWMTGNPVEDFHIILSTVKLGAVARMNYQGPSGALSNQEGGFAYSSFGNIHPVKSHLDCNSVADVLICEGEMTTGWSFSMNPTPWAEFSFPCTHMRIFNLCRKYIFLPANCYCSS